MEYIVIVIGNLQGETSLETQGSCSYYGRNREVGLNHQGGRGGWDEVWRPGWECLACCRAIRKRDK